MNSPHSNEQHSSRDPVAVPEIFDRTLLKAIESDIRVTDPLVINLFGESGNGKSKLLFRLRDRLRESSSFVDCLFEPAPALPGDEAERRIGVRLGGAKQSSQPSSAFASEPTKLTRLPVFMYDDFDQFSLVERQRILRYLRARPHGAIIVASKTDLCTSMPSVSIPWSSHYVPVYSVDEAKRYLSLALPENAVTRVSSHLTEDVTRHPVAVSLLSRALLQDPTVNIPLTVNRISASLQESMVNVLLGILQAHEFEESILYEMTAPSHITPTMLRTLASDNICIDKAKGLLEALFRQGVMSRYSQRYRWAGFYHDAIRKSQPPSHKTFRILLEHPPSDHHFSYEVAKDHFSYLKHAKFGAGQERLIRLHLLHVLEKGLSDVFWFPNDSEFAEILETSAREGQVPGRSLYARYLECRGLYDEALLALADASDLNASSVRLQILDKLGRFAQMLALVQAVTKSSGPAIDESPWTPELCYFFGRCQQGAGSLSNALNSYTMVEEFHEPPVSVRVRALVERATIWVFAEEPLRSLKTLELADHLVANTDSTRGLADIRRYQGRAHKMLACQSVGRARESALASAESCARDLYAISRQYEYREGLIWHKVLECRIAYVHDALDRALALAQRAEQMMRECDYTGGLPHLLRHTALIHARSGDFARAHADLEEACEAAKTAERIYLTGLLADTRAKVLIMERRDDAARKSIQDAIALYDQCGLLSRPFGKLAARLLRMQREPSSIRAYSTMW